MLHCRITFRLIIVTILLAYFSAHEIECLAKPLPQAAAKRVDAAVTAEMKEQEAVGVAVGVILDREVVYLKGYGFADREKKKPATRKTVFNWASNSKPVMAVLALKLVEQGKLDLDADVRTYVPEFPDKGSVITVRHLLCHQSGIPHYSNGEIIGDKLAPDTDESLKDPINGLKCFDRSPLLFEPGSKVSYSTYAYLLLSAVVERAGGQSLQEQLQTEIVKPFQLSSFTTDGPQEGTNWAVGYVRKGKSKEVIRAKPAAHYWKHGAGAYKSNIEDFARWAQALLSDKLLSQEAREAFYAPQTTSDGNETEWGLGIKLARDGNELKIHHNGDQDEASTRLVIYPEAGSGVVIMSNCEFVDPGKFSTAVIKALK